jgi:hypothetical protein
MVNNGKQAKFPNPGILFQDLGSWPEYNEKNIFQIVM